MHAHTHTHMHTHVRTPPPAHTHTHTHQGSKQLYRVLIHPFLVRNETKIDEYVQHFVEKVMSALRKVSRRWLNLAASTVVLSAIKVGARGEGDM